MDDRRAPRLAPDGAVAHRVDPCVVAAVFAVHPEAALNYPIGTFGHREHDLDQLNQADRRNWSVPRAR